MIRILRKLTLVAALAISCTAALASSAAAADICVGTSPSCPAPDYTATAAGFGNALVAAQNVSHPGHDRIILAAATYDIASPLSYTATTNNSLDIIGQGDTTILKPAAPGLTLLDLNMISAPNSSITGIKFAKYAGAESGYPYGLTTREVDARNLTFEVPAQANTSHGMRIMGGSIRDSTFTLGENGVAVLMASDTTASGLTITGDPTKPTYAIRAQGGEEYIVSSSRLRDVLNGFATDQGKFTVSDTLVDLGAIDGAYAIYPANVNSGAYAVGLDGKNLTIVGTGSGQRGIRTDVAGFNSSVVTLQNSVIAMTGPSSSDIYCTNTNSPSSTASVSVGYSLLDPARVYSQACSSSLAPTVTDRTTVASPFADAAAHNFALATGSPAVDAGDPAFAAPAGAKDLAGNARVIGFKDACAPRVDIGAYELQSSTPCAPPVPSATKLSVKFGKVVGKFKLAKKPKAFKIVTKKPKSRVPITLSERTKLKLTLKKGKKTVKGSQSLTVPAGTSYLTFSGRFAGKTLKPGRYTLYVTAPGLQDSPKSVLNVVR